MHYSSLEVAFHVKPSIKSLMRALLVVQTSFFICTLDECVQQLVAPEKTRGQS